MSGAGIFHMFPYIRMQETFLGHWSMVPDE